MTPAQSFDRAQPLINTLAVLGLLVVLLTGCGGGDEIDCDSPADRQQYPEQCMCQQPGQCT
jgi:hypothetical protein